MPIPVAEHADPRLSVKEQIYTVLKDWIIEGTLKPGEKISDAEIAQFFRVSRTPVREVFQLLDSQKLIRVIPCKATIVAPLNTSNIEEFYLPLNHLQALGASLAAEKINAEELADLRRLEAELEASMKSGKLLEALHLDQGFHRKILKIAANPYILDFAETLILHVSRLEYLYFKHASNIDRSFAEHKIILKALQRGDKTLAYETTYQNWQRTMLQIQSMIQGGECLGNSADT